MDYERLVEHAKRIVEDGKKSMIQGYFIEAAEFLRTYAGEKSVFFNNLLRYEEDFIYHDNREAITAILESFIRYVENGLLEGVSIERRVQIDVVSDFLEQANSLLNTKDVHTAAPTVIIGAALEEFLRNWIEEAGLSLGGKKPGIDSYAKVLREEGLIAKQDIKDITSWSGLRNDAAHGEWEKVEQKEKISLMLQGVNLFMRKYS